MFWNFLVEACTFGFVVMAVLSLSPHLPLWMLGFAPAFMVIGAYAEHRAGLSPIRHRR